MIGILNRAEAIIYPHERTFPANVSACAARLRATGVQTSTLWAWCDDLALPDQHSLFIEVMDRFNCLHQIESISDPFLIKRLQDSLQGKTLFLADGHHRFAAGWTLVIYPKLAAGLVMARHAG